MTTRGRALPDATTPASPQANSASRAGPRQPPRTQPLRRRNRNDVVHAAGRLFAERGFHGTSMRDLGETMGLLGSSLYAHIGSKNELLVEVIATGAEQFQALADAVDAEGADAPQRLRRLVAGHVQILTGNADQAATFLNEVRHLDADQRARVVAWRDRYEQTFRSTLAEGVAGGWFRADLDVARTATFVLSLLNGVQRWYRAEGPDTPETVARHLQQFIERAINVAEDVRADL